MINLICQTHELQALRQSIGLTDKTNQQTTTTSHVSDSQKLPDIRFPSLSVRHRSTGPKKVTGERERVLGEKISRKTEEWFNQETGTKEIRTVEIIEKIVEHEVL